MKNKTIEQSQQTNVQEVKIPTVYSLYIKYMLANKEFRASHSDLTNKELMKMAIHNWNDISDTKKKEWKTICIENIHSMNIETLMQLLFNNVTTTSETVQHTMKSYNDIDYELKKESPIIQSRDQMVEILHHDKFIKVNNDDKNVFDKPVKPINIRRCKHIKS